MSGIMVQHLEVLIAFLIAYKENIFQSTDFANRQSPCHVRYKWLFGIKSYNSGSTVVLMQPQLLEVDSFMSLYPLQYLLEKFLGILLGDPVSTVLQ